MFKKFFLFAVPVLSAVVLTSCYEPAERGSSKYGYHALLVADRWGNGNGTAEPEEIEYLLNYFEDHREAWCLGHYPWPNVNEGRVRIETLWETFKASERSEPAPGEADLREKLGDASLRTPFVGIYVLTFDGFDCDVEKFYRAPGPDVGRAQWTEIKIVR